MSYVVRCGLELRLHSPAVARGANRYELVDLQTRESGFAKDLDAVLAKARLQATNLRHRAAEPCRNGRHPDTALGRMVELRPEVGRHKLFVASPARVRNGSVNLIELPKVMA